MNKILKSLALTALATGAVCAHDHTNHTTMNLRSQGYNLPMNYTTFNELISRNIGDNFGGNFQVTGFYQGSNSGHELGKYFGFAHKHEMHLGHALNEALYNNPAFDLDSAYLIYDYAPYGADIRIKFDPQSESYGATLAYYRDLAKIAKGLYLSVSLPIVHIENNMRMKVDAVDTSENYWPVAADVISYFRGTYIGWEDETNFPQAPLTKAKIDGKRCATGVADIEVKLGYNFLNKEKYHLGINIGATFPTGNKNKADYVFEPIVGNGKHWALGGGLEGNYRVWQKDKQNIKLGMAVDYRYLFENDEYRTPGLKNVATGVTRNWGQYHLLGHAGPTIGEYETTLLTPAANVITQNCNVTPGSQVEGLANFAYNNGGFTFDLGYNLFWREKEEVKSHKTLPVERYGVANRELYSPDGSVEADYYGNNGGNDASLFGVYSSQFDEGYAAEENATTPLYWLAQSHLDFHQAETPAVLTHKIYSGIGYSFKEWDTPFMMGVGGSYEFASENSAPDVWSVYGKLGMAF